jgi:hypothetical protein
MTLKERKEDAGEGYSSPTREQKERTSQDSERKPSSEGNSLPGE